MSMWNVSEMDVEKKSNESKFRTIQGKWPVLLGRVTYLPVQWMVHLRNLSGYPVLARVSAHHRCACTWEADVMLRCVCDWEAGVFTLRQAPAFANLGRAASASVASPSIPWISK